MATIWPWAKATGIPCWDFRCTTHVRIYFSGDWDVHWGCDLDFDPWPYGDIVLLSWYSFCWEKRTSGFAVLEDLSPKERRATHATVQSLDRGGLERLTGCSPLWHAEFPMPSFSQWMPRDCLFSRQVCVDTQAILNLPKC